MNAKSRFFAYLPLAALCGYWLYACVGCALLSGDVRLLKLSFVSAPLVLGLALCAFKLARSAPR
ncbi:MAG: hypothetical protein A2X31_07805 [Elusimicrobia bacterium GWB2_63_22]|nr:MAG: hypothetical protein A2X31_07805 [Elusimicrobia bacterium GWB2_63_22]